ncbi:pyridoxal-dependent decarboxylase [Brevundimonas sp.]|uniref:pyridoxal phosphate-dependent decarboxylase family protein n=1 Tax=Brevundimonas sp. TaxID=1871086 RepID=UPI0025B9CAE7|nr:pyridoxal-dependent decarboxylase [Brevundimonas sp.]
MSQSTAAVIAGAYFPGPRSENETWVRGEFQAVLDQWFGWRKALFVDDPAVVSAADRLSPDRLERREILSQRLGELCAALTAETPTYTPRYIGHMKAEVSLPALFGWLAAMLHNPNNTSREASTVGTVIEAEAIGMLAAMVGYDPAVAQGHFTSGGTVANFEAVWRARYRMDHWLSLGLYISEKTGAPLDVFAAAHMGWDRFRALWSEHGLTDAVLRRYSAAVGTPADIWRRISRAAGRDYLGPVMLVPGNKHYSWSKAANLFGLGEESLWPVALDAEGRLEVDDLERLAQRAEAEGRPVLMAVGVAGTTETGEIDPIDALHDRLERWEAERGVHVWRHVDAAYGGFLCAILGGPDEAVLTPASAAALRAIGRADSVTIDPHKLGYVPYACGAFLTRDAARYAVSAFDAPYLDRPELGDGKWSSTLEGSRSAAGAAATWLTGRTLGFGPEGMGSLLAETIRARQAFQTAVAEAVPEVRFLEPADANIVCFSVARPGEPLSLANRRTEALFEAIHRSHEFSVSKTTLGDDYAAVIARHVSGYGGVRDTPGLVLVRCVFMNPYWAGPAFRTALFPPFIALLREVIARPVADL